MTSRFQRLLSTSPSFGSILSYRQDALYCRATKGGMKRFCWSLSLGISYSSPALLSAVDAFSSLSQPSIISSTKHFPTGGIVRYLSKTRLDNEDYDDDFDEITTTTIEKKLPNEYSTSYHAPVMWKECIQALLECELLVIF